VRLVVFLTLITSLGCFRELDFWGLVWVRCGAFHGERLHPRTATGRLDSETRTAPSGVLAEHTYLWSLTLHRNQGWTDSLQQPYRKQSSTKLETRNLLIVSRIRRHGSAEENLRYR
jgi:hypothetical protein